MTQMVTTLKETQTNSMQVAKNYVNEVFETVQKRNPGESEFHQAVKEIFDSLFPVFANTQNIWKMLC